MNVCPFPNLFLLWSRVSYQLGCPNSMYTPTPTIDLLSESVSIITILRGRVSRNIVLKNRSHISLGRHMIVFWPLFSLTRFSVFWQNSCMPVLKQRTKYNHFLHDSFVVCYLNQKVTYVDNCSYNCVIFFGECNMTLLLKRPIQWITLV